jgi:3-hydroxyacyl-CoA dehydrogenase
MVELSEEALTQGLDRVRRSLLTMVERERLTGAQADRQLAALRGTIEYRDLGALDLVIEAVFEDYASKQAVARTGGGYRVPSGRLRPRLCRRLRLSPLARRPDALRA